MKKVFSIVALILLLAPISLRAAGPSFLNNPELKARFDMWRSYVDRQELQRSKIPKKVIKKVTPTVSKPSVKKTVIEKQNPISPSIPTKDTNDQTVGTPLQPASSVPPVKPNIVQYQIDEALVESIKSNALKLDGSTQKSSSLLNSLGSAVWLSVEGAYNMIVSWLK